MTQPLEKRSPEPPTAPVHKGWFVLLEDLEKRGFGRCFIAGGAVRDALCDRDPKDLDVFVHWDRSYHGDYSSFVDRVQKEFGNELIRYFNPGYEEESDPTVLGVVTLDFAYIPYPVQLIAVDRKLGEPWEIEHALQRIDLGLCRAAYGRDEGVFVQNDFIHDSLGERMTVLRCETWSQFRGSCKRHWRLREKFPDHDLFIESFRIPWPVVKMIAEKHPKAVHALPRMYSPVNAESVKRLASSLGY